MDETDRLVDAVVEDPRWQECGLADLAETAARAALASIGRDPGHCEIGLLGTDDTGIAKLNAEFRGSTGATNVLSWPAHPMHATTPSEPQYLGDIALAYDTCAREAELAGIPLGAHASHLVVHGVLHLLGHDHQSEPEAERMETLEAKILARLGLPNPYSR